MEMPARGAAPVARQDWSTASIRYTEMNSAPVPHHPEQQEARVLGLAYLVREPSLPRAHGGRCAGGTVRQREAEGKRRARPGAGIHPDPAVHRFDQLLGDVQAQSGALRLPDRAGLDAVEALE